MALLHEENTRGVNLRWDGSVLPETPAELNKAAPVLGQDSYEVYTRILGPSDEEFTRRLQAGMR